MKIELKQDTIPIKVMPKIPKIPKQLVFIDKYLLTIIPQPIKEKDII